jgi:hypothetical protein
MAPSSGLKRSAFNLRYQVKAERVQGLSGALHFAKIRGSGFSRNALRADIRKGRDHDFTRVAIAAQGRVDHIRGIGRGLLHYRAEGRILPSDGKHREAHDEKATPHPAHGGAGALFISVLAKTALIGSAMGQYG